MSYTETEGRFTWQTTAAILGLDDEDHENDEEIHAVAIALEMYYQKRREMESGTKSVKPPTPNSNK